MVKRTENCFNKLKALLISEPVVIAPIFQKQFMLAIDSSGIGCGGKWWRRNRLSFFIFFQVVWVYASKILLYLWEGVPCSSAAKQIHCAQNGKTVRLCIEFNKSKSNIFWYAIYCGISKMAAIDLESSTWVKNWNMLRFLWK